MLLLPLYARCCQTLVLAPRNNATSSAQYLHRSPAMNKYYFNTRGFVVRHSRICRLSCVRLLEMLAQMMLMVADGVSTYHLVFKRLEVNGWRFQKKRVFFACTSGITDTTNQLYPFIAFTCPSQEVFTLCSSRRHGSGPLWVSANGFSSPSCRMRGHFILPGVRTQYIQDQPLPSHSVGPSSLEADADQDSHSLVIS